MLLLDKIDPIFGLQYVMTSIKVTLGLDFSFPSVFLPEKKLASCASLVGTRVGT
jgi:hypothetical protein